MSAAPHLWRRLRAKINRQLAERRLFRARANLQVIAGHITELEALHTRLADEAAQAYTAARRWQLAEDVLTGRHPDRLAPVERPAPILFDGTAYGGTD